MKKWYYLLVLCVLFSCKEDDGPDAVACSQGASITLRTGRSWAYTGSLFTLYGDEGICRSALKSVSVNGKEALIKDVASDSLRFTFPVVSEDSATITVVFKDFEISVSQKVAVFAGTVTWKEVQAFPGTGRVSTRPFVVNNKAYVLGGTRLTYTYTEPMPDLYEYDPAVNVWRKSFESQPLASANDKAVIHGGLICQLVNPWKYTFFDPTTNTFNDIAIPRLSSFFAGVPLNGESYLIMSPVNVSEVKVLRYDKAGNLWNTLITQPHTPDNYYPFESSFEIGGKAYFTMNPAAKTTVELMSYDPVSNTLKNEATLRMPVTDTYEAHLKHLCTVGKLAYFMEAGEVVVSSDENINIRLVPSSRLYIYNAALNAWYITTTEYPGKFISPTCFTVGNRGFVGLGATKVTEMTVAHPQNFYEFIPQ